MSALADLFGQSKRILYHNGAAFSDGYLEMSVMKLLEAESRSPVIGRVVLGMHMEHQGLIRRYMSFRV